MSRVDEVVSVELLLQKSDSDASMMMQPLESGPSLSGCFIDLLNTECLTRTHLWDLLKEYIKAHAICTVIPPIVCDSAILKSNLIASFKEESVDVHSTSICIIFECWIL